ncbi:hypothetical protein PIB30_037118 [Stylosanthes scabra]|uniref:Uncharacterized protein n=1 Tax=Stylosanthes scabra TaxID=79078 RepID=A0ABU6ZCD0_9FABA|nr:hypothetical protein [Stylosanthes scabra]
MLGSWKRWLPTVVRSEREIAEDDDCYWQWENERRTSGAVRVKQGSQWLFWTTTVGSDNASMEVEAGAGNTTRITLCEFWTSRRPMVRLKRKCIDLECKEHGFHEVTWSTSNQKKSAKLIGFSSGSKIT